nr:hypothetical protein [Tanacetum cinerariifolium]
PALQKDMALVAANLDLTVDYGWLWFLSQPLFKLLSKSSVGILRVSGINAKEVAIKILGEDVLELQGHGSPLLMDLLIKRILSIKHTRLAKPGEFCERAFLNGKIDLVQAEAIDDLINSETESMAKESKSAGGIVLTGSAASKSNRGTVTAVGPKGRNVVLDKSFGAPSITKDGVSVAREIELEDKFENMGAQMVKEVASKANDAAGDGTTTATLLAQSIVNEGLKAVAAGMNPMDLKRVEEGTGLQNELEVVKDTTTIIGGVGEKHAIQSRISQIRQEIQEATSDYDKEKLNERLAKLSGGVAVLKVGAATEVEMKEKKARVEDALHATRAAVEE